MKGELDALSGLPDGPYAVGLTHTPRGDYSPPWTVTAGCCRAVAGHVPSKAIADAIAFALNMLHPGSGMKRTPQKEIP